MKSQSTESLYSLYSIWLGIFLAWDAPALLAILHAGQSNLTPGIATCPNLSCHLCHDVPFGFFIGPGADEVTSQASSSSSSGGKQQKQDEAASNETTKLGSLL